MTPEDRLSEEQRYFIDIEMTRNKNYWIKGFAGSGKSILLIHGIHDLIKKNNNIRICVVVFTNSLKELFIAGFRELKIPKQNVYICTYHQFKKEDYSFDYIFCDEVQDLPKSILEKMKLNAKYVIVGGDSNQSIYGTDPQTNEPTANESEITNLLNPNTWILKTIYRLSRSLVRSVSSLIPSMGILEAKTDNTKRDVTPNLANASTKDKEVEYIFSKAKDEIANGESTVIILPTHQHIVEFLNKVLALCGKNQWDENDERNKNKYGKVNYNILNSHLSQNGIDIVYIGNGYGNLFAAGEMGKIIIMTYHSSKGLDFYNVYLPFISNAVQYPWFNETLFMVGITRSKLALHITYSGTMHQFAKKIEHHCNKIDIDTILNQKNKVIEDDFDF